jgi:ribosome-binding protein aMBF1 (putative translation factor)
MTLAELKQRFQQLTGDQIREVLPPGNAREARARERKERTGKVTETTQGIGSRGGEARSEPEPKKDEVPKAPAEPRYVEELGDLAERVLAARQLMGRNRLAELLGITGSATWRAEQGRVHPSEVDALRSALEKVEDRIAQGEFVKAERQPKVASPSKAELTDRIQTVRDFIKNVRGDKSVTKGALADGVLALLDPPTEAVTETQ